MSAAAVAVLVGASLFAGALVLCIAIMLGLQLSNAVAAFWRRWGWQ